METVHLVSLNMVTTMVPVIIHVQLVCIISMELVCHVTSLVLNVTEVYSSIVMLVMKVLI